MEKPINAFPTYEMRYNDKKKQWDSWYRGINLGRGGWAYSIPGIYSNVALLDCASMHPTSIEMLNKLGKYTPRYSALKQARVFIKHKDYESAGKLFDGKLKKYLTDPSTAKMLSKALKLPINGFYGISSASFENPARDSRDKNNIIAARGALFMKTLWDAVEDFGYFPFSVKTDSIKIADATPEVISFVQDFARKYGYEIEHEGTYERICIVDKSNYIATFMHPDECMKRYGYVPADNKDQFDDYNHPWTVTGDTFANPYAFKTVFTGEPFEFKDLCTVKKVKDAKIFLDFNEGMNDVKDAEEEKARRVFNETEADPDDPKKKPKKLNPNFAGFTDKSLDAYIAEGHCYEFVGRVGNFFPVEDGTGGGWLLVKRNNSNKYDAVSGTKGYRWMEAEKGKLLEKENCYNRKYFDEQVDKVIKAINTFGSFDRFIDLSRPYVPPDDISPAADDSPPWSVVPCGDGKFNDCLECPHYKGSDICGRGYSLATYVQKGGDDDVTG